MRTVITAITISTFFLSGCVTPMVWNIGLHPRTAEGGTVYKAEDQSLALEARVTGFKRSQTRYFVTDGKSLEAWLRAKPSSLKHSPQSVPIFIGHGHSGTWQEYPSESVTRDAIITDLPVKFTANVSTYAFKDPIAVIVEGKTEHVILDGFIGLKKDRDPKTYPVLPLLLPAAVVDVAIGIVMTPVLIILFLFEGISGTRRKSESKSP